MFKGDLEGDLEVDLEGDSNGDFKQDMEGDLLSSSGLVEVWFRLQFDSLLEEHIFYWKGLRATEKDNRTQ